MTDLLVSDQRPRVGYVADGVTQAFPVPFLVLAAEHLRVSVEGEADAPAYEVTGVGAESGGSVVFAVAPESGKRIEVWRAMPIERNAHFMQAGELRAAALNGEFTRLVLMLQELAARADETLRVGPTESAGLLALPNASSRAGRLLAFDVTGTPSVILPPGAEGLAEHAQLNLATVAAADAAEASASAAAAAAANALAVVDSLGALSGIPVGTVIDFCGATPPARWFWCDGGMLDPALEPELFAVLGTTYGGDGTATFGLPDLRGRVVAGRDDMGGAVAARLSNRPGGVNGVELGAAGGTEAHVLSIAEMPEHSHPGSGYYVRAATSGGTTLQTGGGSFPNVNSASSVHGQGANQSHNNIQPTFILNKIVFAGA